jgi:hypothetical protein
MQEVKIDISFVGISGQTTVFESMSEIILGQDGMHNKGNDLRNVLIHFDQEIISLQIGTRRFECLFVSNKYLDYFSFDDLNGVTDSISFN